MNPLPVHCLSTQGRIFPRVSFCSVVLALMMAGAALAAAAGPLPVLERSDVVFMYQAEPAVYADYGATVLAWGGRPASNSPVRVFGSVGMVTEFSRYYERFPESYTNGLCRDVNGQPFKVPWLTDHQHKGIPYWWCCTQQPQFRQYVRERVVNTVKAGTYGVHIDDHLGSAGALWLGACFCDRCVEGFQQYLQRLPADTRDGLGIAAPQSFNYREVVGQWIAADLAQKRTPPQHQLWRHWTIYQCRAAASFMGELRALAQETAGRPVPIGANAGLLWPRHLTDYQALDLFSAEIDHHASARKFSELPLMAYRMADAMARPLASTASGGDWAFIKEQNLPGLVQGWIALSYAAGNCLMAPHRQWCYTPQKGTHWYAGPKEKFAPLYRFVRQNAAAFDGFTPWADLIVVMPHGAFVKNPNRWFDRANQLAAANVSYRLAIGGDAIVDRPLAVAELQGAPVLWAPDREELLPADQERLRSSGSKALAGDRAADVIRAVSPAVRVTTSNAPVRIFPRVKPGEAVVHVLNWQYDAGQDDVQTLEQVELAINLKALGLGREIQARLLSPGKPARDLRLEGGTARLAGLGLWTVLHLQSR